MFTQFSLALTLAVGLERTFIIVVSSSSSQNFFDRIIYASVRDAVLSGRAREPGRPLRVSPVN